MIVGGRKKSFLKNTSVGGRGFYHLLASLGTEHGSAGEDTDFTAVVVGDVLLGGVDVDAGLLGSAALEGSSGGRQERSDGSELVKLGVLAKLAGDGGKEVMSGHDRGGAARRRRRRKVGGRRGARVACRAWGGVPRGDTDGSDGLLDGRVDETEEVLIIVAGDEVCG
jgi:hypothetical protein